jgi:hypothetical protein
MSHNHSAEWLRAKCEAASDIHKAICQAAVHSEEAMGIAYTWSDAAEAASDYEDHHRTLLAEAEAREASVPTAAEVIADLRDALNDLLPSTREGYFTDPERRGLAAVAKAAAWEAARK